MRLELTYSEIEKYLKKHQGYVVDLSHVDSRTIRVKTIVEWRVIIRHTIDVDVNVALDKIVGNDMYLSYSFHNQKLEMAAKNAFHFGGSIISRKFPMIEKKDGNNLIVHLNKINKLCDVLMKVNLTDVGFNQSSAIITIGIQ